MKLSGKGKFYFVSACLFSGLYSVLATYLNYCLSLMVDAAGAGDRGLLWKYALWSMGLLLIYVMVTILASALQSFYLADGTLSMQERMARNMLRRPLQSFRQRDNAYYINLFTTDTNMYMRDYLTRIPYVVNSLAMLLSALVLLCYLSPLLMVTTLLLAGAPFAVSRIATGRIQSRRKLYSQASERQVGVLKENLEGNEAIRGDGTWPVFAERFHRASEEKYRSFGHYSFAREAGSYSSTDILLLIEILEIALATWLVACGRLSAGMLVAVISCVSSITAGAGNLIEYLMYIHSTKELRHKLQAECSAPELQESTEIQGLPASVRYNEVSFSFGERQLYDRISCDWKPGECIAIVGESGSGKSTLMKLLLKYYEDYTGTIYLAGRDIRELAEWDVNRLVGTVNQSPCLFNASLYENITMFSGKPGEDSEEYHALLEALNLTELAACIGNQSLGDFGDNISGGERQRINLARVFRRRPAVMILDEPTTGLDPENVRLINEFIFSHKEMTRIVITHDWSADYLARFDSVVKLSDNQDDAEGIRNGSL